MSVQQSRQGNKVSSNDPWEWDDIIELGEHVPVLLPIHPEDDDFIDIDPTAPVILPFDGVDYIDGDDLVPLGDPA